MSPEDQAQLHVAIVANFLLADASPQDTLLVLSNVVASYMAANKTIYDINAEEAMRAFVTDTINTTNKLIAEKGDSDFNPNMN